MTYIHNLVSLIKKYVIITSFGFTDVLQLIIIAVVFYGLILWFRRTRAWALFKGIIVVLVFVLLAQIFNMDVILWIASKALSVSIVAIFVIFQPELRRALEELGQRRIFKRFLSFGKDEAEYKFSNETMEEVAKAVLNMSDDKVGALIVFQMDVGLMEYERTGIRIDSAVSSEIIENIFVENTPLHDGGIIIIDDRLAAATCYLPLSENLSISKRYGTRHRAALGLSEVSDAFIIIVSEETGHISVAERGKLYENLNESELRNRMIRVQHGEYSSILDEDDSDSTVNRLMERIMKRSEGEGAASDNAGAPPDNNGEGGDSDA